MDHSSRREFGHCIVTWEVINYNHIAWKEKNEIETAIFTVRGPGLLVTNWKLILEHELSEKTVKNISTESFADLSKTETETSAPKYGHFSFYLMRCDSDRDRVWVDWRVRCSRSGKEECSVVVGEENYFDKGFKHGLDLGVVCDFEREIQYPGTLTFQCQMMVHDGFAAKSFDNSVDTDLSNLSEDLKSIVKQNKFYDFEMKFGEKSLHAHKALFCTRCKNFQNVSTSDGCYVISMPEEEYEGVLKILEYVYSGDLSKVVNKPSIKIYDAILELDLPELEEYFIPEEYKLCTKIDAQELMYTWAISDFSTKDEYCLSSPILTNDRVDNSWQIHLYPRGITNKSDNITVCVENTEGNLWDELCIQCAVLKEEKAFQQWKTLQMSSEVAELFESIAFMEREPVIKSLENDELKLGFKVTACIGKMHLILENSTSLYPKLNPLLTLTKDMSFLRRSDKYTDVNLRTGNGEIKAHKCILSARSRVLSSMLDRVEDNCLDLSDIKCEIMNALLDYMYCALLHVSDVNTLLEVYKAAEKLAMSCLREKCSRTLQVCLKAENISDVLNLADDYGDKLLKEKAVDFVQLNFSVIREHESWEELKFMKPSLCREIERSLQSDVTEIDRAAKESNDNAFDAYDKRSATSEENDVDEVKTVSEETVSSNANENICDTLEPSTEAPKKTGELKERAKESVENNDANSVKICETSAENGASKVKLMTKESGKSDEKNSSKIMDPSAENGDKKIEGKANESNDVKSDNILAISAESGKDKFKDTANKNDKFKNGVNSNTILDTSTKNRDGKLKGISKKEESNDGRSKVSEVLTGNCNKVEEVSEADNSKVQETQNPQ